MTAVFIFAEQIREALAAGKKAIEVPEGARISAAAYDIIRENKLRLTYIRPKAAETGAPEDEPAAGETTAAKASAAPTEPDAPVISSASESEADISEAEVEVIVDRVIKRFRSLKGSEAGKVRSDQAPAAEVAAGPDEAYDDDMVICRCEEITKAEIKAAINNGMRTLNGIKRITRAGMGLCQGQTCQRLVSKILSEELGLSAAEIEPTTARGPVRPLRLKVFANR